VAHDLGAPSAHGRLDRQLTGQGLVVVDDEQVGRGRASSGRQRLGRWQGAQRLVQGLDDLREPECVGGAEQRAGVEQASGLPGQARRLPGFDQPERSGELVRLTRGAAPGAGIEAALECRQRSIFERGRARGEGRRVGQPHERRRGVFHGAPIVARLGRRVRQRLRGGRRGARRGRGAWRWPRGRRRAGLDRCDLAFGAWLDGRRV
jgi:hypothetical protein